jgi:hypothetical protein
MTKEEIGTNLVNHKTDNSMGDEDYACPTCGVAQCDPECDNNAKPTKEKEPND